MAEAGSAVGVGFGVGGAGLALGEARSCLGGADDPTGAALWALRRERSWGLTLVFSSSKSSKKRE